MVDGGPRYLIIAPLGIGIDDPDLDLSLEPFDLGGKTYVRVIEPALERVVIDAAEQWVGRAFTDYPTVVLQLELSAPPDDPDSIVRTALDACLALWISKRCNVDFHRVYFLRRAETREWQVVNAKQYARWSSGIAYRDAQLCPQDLVLARAVFAGLREMRQGETPLTAARFMLHAARTGRHWAPIFVLTCIALDALFGASEGGKLKKRFVRRAAAFLSVPPGDLGARREYYDDLYRWRSEALHGMAGVKSLEDAERIGLLDRAGAAIRDAMIRILTARELREVFSDNVERERYLNQLVK